MQRPPYQQRLSTLDRSRLGQEELKTALCLPITRDLLIGSMSIARELLAMQSPRPHPQLPESESASRPEGDEPTHESLSGSAVSHKSVTHQGSGASAPFLLFLQQALQTCGSPGPDESQKESSKGKRKEERISKTAYICSGIRSADSVRERGGEKL